MRTIKRRKYNDNFYKLYFDHDKKVYFVEFKDSKGLTQNIRVDVEIYNIFNKSELKELSQLNEYDRHIEHFDVFNNEELLYRKMNFTCLSIEQIVENNFANRKLFEALNMLGIKQKRRIFLYYFENMTLDEISRIEECSIHSVHVAIKNGIKTLKKCYKCK